MFVSREATILHADVDSFFASVEQRDDPALRGRPVIVGGWVVLAASYEAKAAGVKTAMSAGEARRRCPGVVVVQPRMRAYSEASQAMFTVFDDASPLVEPLSIDEAFLDVRGMHRIAGSPAEIAARLRRDVRERVGLPITVGVARTKFLAKVASGVAKPDGLLVVEPDRELAFLHPLEVERLWGVGPATARKLHAVRLFTVGDVAGLSEETLIALLGRASGRQLYALSRNHDARRVRPGRRRGSIGAQRALGRSSTSPEALDTTLVALVDRITRRMRSAGRVGRTVVLRLRFGDFARATRSHTLPRSTAQTLAILATARALLAAAQPEIAARGLTLVGISVTNLESDGAVQLVLPFADDGQDAVDSAVDAVRNRFGTAAITRGVLVGRDGGFEMPHLPD
jgi:DNA polymerase IV